MRHNGGHARHLSGVIRFFHRVCCGLAEQVTGRLFIVIVVGPIAPDHPTAQTVDGVPSLGSLRLHFCNFSRVALQLRVGSPSASAIAFLQLFRRDAAISE